MPKMSISVPHELGQEGAAERLKGFLGRIRERHESQVRDLQEEWLDNVLKFSFKTYGFAIKGAAEIEASEVKLDCDLPFAAMMFKGKIEQEMKEALARALAS